MLYSFWVVRHAQPEQWNFFSSRISKCSAKKIPVKGSVSCYKGSPMDISLRSTINIRSDICVHHKLQHVYFLFRVKLVFYLNSFKLIRPQMEPCRWFHDSGESMTNIVQTLFNTKWWNGVERKANNHLTKVKNVTLHRYYYCLLNNNNNINEKASQTKQRALSVISLEAIIKSVATFLGSALWIMRCLISTNDYIIPLIQHRHLIKNHLGKHLSINELSIFKLFTGRNHFLKAG